MVLIRVPPGWTASEEGYFLNVEALTELTAAAKTYRLERDAWERAYYELFERTEGYGRSLESQVVALKEEMAAESAAWRRKVSATRGPGLGVFAGYGTSGATVGVGLVWRLF